jgi:hypothetical protein
MKMKSKVLHMLASTALVGMSLSPMAATSAYATITPTSTTTAAMESQCAADLAPYAGILLHDGTPAYSTEVVETGQSDGPTTEVPLSRVIDESSRFGTGTPTYSGLTILGDPYKVGGSVNMFGLQGARYKNWPNSEYDFTADYSTTTTISYECHVTQVTETLIPGEHIPGSPWYVNPQDNSAGDCRGITPNHPFWGQDIGACHWTGTGSDPVDTEDEWINNGPTDRPDLTTLHTIDETNIADDVAGHEVNGGPFTEEAAPGTLWNAGQVVVCISPKKLPGIWTNQNGYSGNKCTTVWYNATVWGAGTNTAQGTLISVPAI